MSIGPITTKICSTNGATGPVLATDPEHMISFITNYPAISSITKRQKAVNTCAHQTPKNMIWNCMPIAPTPMIVKIMVLLLEAVAIAKRNVARKVSEIIRGLSPNAKFVIWTGICR